MGEDFADIHDLPFVFDCGNQPALVVAYIKDHKAPNHVGVLPTVANLGKVFPICILRDLVPGIERRAPFAVPSSRFPNGLPTYDAHKLSSHYEKLASSQNSRFCYHSHALVRSGDLQPSPIGAERVAQTCLML